MKRLVKNHLAAGIVAALLLYWAVAPFLPRPMVLEQMKGLLLAAGAGIIISFWAGVWMELKSDRVTGGQLISLGIITLVFFLFLTFVWAYAYWIFDAPPWMQANLIRGWLDWGIFSGEILILFGVGADEDSVLAKRNWWRLGVIAACALLITSVLLSLVGSAP